MLSNLSNVWTTTIQIYLRRSKTFEEFLDGGSLFWVEGLESRFWRERRSSVWNYSPLSLANLSSSVKLRLSGTLFQSHKQLWQSVGVWHLKKRWPNDLPWVPAREALCPHHFLFYLDGDAYIQQNKSLCVCVGGGGGACVYARVLLFGLHSCIR